MSRLAASLARRLLLPGLLALATVAAAQELPRTAPERVGLAPERLARIDSVMNAYVTGGRVAGVVTLIAREGQVAQLKGYGKLDLAAGTAMPTDAIFRIASQSKAITSVAAMILVEEGKLLLGEPISRYIPGFAQARVAVEEGTGAARTVREVPLQRQVTVRDLLTHTSGLSYGSGPAQEAYRQAGIENWYFADRDEPIGATIDRLATLPLNAQPGSRYIYGYSTDVLGVVVERASGMSLDEFVRSRILRPLGMNDTHFYLPPEKQSRLATVYSATPAGGIERAPTQGTMVSQGAYVTGPRKSFSGGAGLLSTAADYAKFLQMMLNEGELNGARILSPATVRLMTQDHLGEIYTNPGLGFGLGFEVLEQPGLAARMGEPGAYRWGGAYYSTYWVDPARELVAVLMIQLIPAGTVDLQEKFRNLVYQSIVE